MALELRSPAFAPNGEIPTRYTCEGEDLSPPLAWSGVPKGAKSLALVVDDPDAPDPRAPKRVWVHWVLLGIPPSVSALEEGAAQG
ncbi:MAG TPA: YbhB/YbcL family Raf kinase inhibitor-like protein, partial [Vicinamibacteria bacterium]|nr:YbhB/YbcL family Raf kinase inhibitor-like protein [Vicinamibacteria bacterium]